MRSSASWTSRSRASVSRDVHEFTKHIIHNRTILMHHRLALPLRGGRVFVAVGAMHLYGSKGLLASLQRDGCVVTRIW